MDLVEDKYPYSKINLRFHVMHAVSFSQQECCIEGLLLLKHSYPDHFHQKPWFASFTSIVVSHFFYYISFSGLLGLSGADRQKLSNQIWILQVKILNIKWKKKTLFIRLYINNYFTQTVIFFYIMESFKLNLTI